jgi:hypothetical protein
VLDNVVEAVLDNGQDVELDERCPARPNVIGDGPGGDTGLSAKFGKARRQGGLQIALKWQICPQRADDQANVAVRAVDRSAPIKKVLPGFLARRWKRGECRVEVDVDAPKGLRDPIVQLRREPSHGIDRS